MLIQIDVANLITIENLHLELHSGTTVITGETGAGKSILIDAIELALGGRATSDIVRPGHAKADISITFSVANLPLAQQWLNAQELDNPSAECIIRRTVYQDGRSRSYINGIPSTLQLLRELGSLLLNIHGQHEHQALFKQETQRDLLDRYAGHEQLAKQVMTLAQECQTLASTITDLQKSTRERDTRSEYLRFQLRELDELDLKVDELQTLDLEHKKLANAGELLQNLTHAINQLSTAEEANVLDLLNDATDALETVQTADPKINPWLETLKTSIIQLNDTNSELQRYLEKIELDPARLQQIEQRIGAIFDVARKHKISPQELLELQNNLANELATLDTDDERLAELTNKLQATETAYETTATELSFSRAEAAKKLALEITTTIHTLSLPHGQFEICLLTNDLPRYATYGKEKILFQIAMNVGQAMQPLAKVASGGELSRIGLAIHMATAEQHTTPTLIFDEIDVGIGGGTAEIVGKSLRQLGETHQLLCVTHLPQVAARGHQHLLVEKCHYQEATYTEIRQLRQKERISEIARMLGGVDITLVSLEHAEEMLDTN